ncbi:hypothetical protein [Lutibacter sp.]
MRKIILLLITTLILSSFNTNLVPDFNIIGKWKAVENNEVGYIVFQENGYAYFELQGQILGGKEFMINGEKGSMTYEIDYSKSPMTIDLIIKTFKNNKTKRLLCIAEKIDTDKIHFAIGFQEGRPTNFKQNDGLIFNRYE